jgi:hypothetical protein
LAEIPTTPTIVESQMGEALTRVRRAISDGLVIKFGEDYSDPDEPGVSYWGDAVLELIGAYAKNGTIAVR